MTETVGEAIVELRGGTDKLTSDVSSAGKTAGSSFGTKFATAAKVGLLAVGVAAGAFLKGAVSEAREAQKVTALTTQVIKSTGAAANVSVDQVANLAGAISAKAGIDDEAIQAGENLILTFKNIRNEAGKGNDIFNQTTQAATDMSVAMGTDMKGAALQLGKALNDPTKGVAALARSGVTFTDQQKEQIKAMQESGNILGAQKLVLGEVQSEFGGAAAAAANSGDKFKVAFGNLEESVGGVILPLIDGVLDKLTGFVGFLTTDVGPALSTMGDYARRAWVVFSHGGQILDVLGDAASTIGAAFSAAFGSSGLGSSAGIMGTFTSLWERLTPILYQAGGALMQIIPVIADGIAGAITAVAPVVKQMVATFTGELLPAIIAVVGWVRTNLFPVFLQVAGIIRDQVLPIVGELALWLYGTLYPAILRIAMAVIRNLKPVFDQLVKTFRDQVLPALQQLLTKFHEWQPTIQKVIGVVVQIIGWFLKFTATILAKVLPPVIRLVGFFIGHLIPVIIQTIERIAAIIGIGIKVGAMFVSVGKKVVEFAGHLVDLARRGLDTVVDAVTSLPGRLLALGGKMLDAGKSIIGKFVDGMKNAAGIVGGIAGNVWDAVRGLINGAIDHINAALSFTIHLPGPDISINPPDIGHLALGTSSWGGGLALLGEHGRELVDLPRGARVHTAARTEELLGAGRPNATIQVMLPTGDPEAAAQAVAARWVTAGGW